MKEVDNQSLWNFGLGSQKSMIVLIWINIRFQQRDRQGSQNLKNDSFFRLSVTSAQCTLGTDKYSNAGILLNFDDDNVSRRYAQNEEIFRDLTKDFSDFFIFQPFISDTNFNSSNVRADDVGFNLYVIKISYQQKLQLSNRLS